MSPEFEQVEVRTDRRIVPNAARFDDGSVFIPDCRVEEGDEIRVDGERYRVTRCATYELRHRTGMVAETEGCRLSLEKVPD